jgi:periplasmic protein TonB
MAVESRPVSGSELGSLQSCLVGSDPEQQNRERRVRRRALVISIATQSVVVAAIVLVPLFLKPERISANITPVPPYYTRVTGHTEERSTPRAPKPQQNVCRFCAPLSIPRTVAMRDEPQNKGDEGQTQGFLDGPGRPGSVGDGIPIVDTRVPAQPQVPRVETPHTVHVAHIDPAMLTRRIEPVYPPLMRQIGRSGQVQLRAMIGTDGTIQSLQVVNGDPGFYQSAMEAVRQWRYRPTVLNGTAVEVDTFITVIYNISR